MTLFGEIPVAKIEVETYKAPAISPFDFIKPSLIHNQELINFVNI